MKKFKKLIALTCVAAMLVPTVAFAADPTSETGTPSTGDSVIENDNSVKPAYTSVDLPTITDGTYDFQIDRDHLLADYDYVSTHDGDSYVYFKAENAPATAVNAAGDDHSLYLKETVIADESAKTAFLGKFTTSTLTGVLTGTEGYYVWVPTTADPTRGEFQAISDTNVTNIVEWSDAGTPDDTDDDKAVLRIDFNSGDFIWDGNIYYDTYTLLSATEAVEYITVDASNAVTAVNANLYKANSTAATETATNATAAAKEDITYTPATTQYIDESDAAKVVNKSTTPIVVSVKVDMKTTEGITYVGKDDIATDTENASLYIAIEDEANHAVAVNNDTRNATAYYVLAGAVNNTTKYQGKSDDLNQATGSHNYYQYEKPYPTYAEHSFKIVADVNESGDADPAWKTYVDSLTEPGKKPTIEVVYSWEVVEETETANVYADLAGENLYTTDGSTGWATGAPAHTHTFTDYTDTTCDGEGCDYERTAYITAPITFTANGDGSKHYISIGSGASISDVKVYDANEYANSGSSAAIATAAITKDNFSVSSSGNAAILTTDLTTNLTTAGDYVFVITTDTKAYTVIYTVTE